MGIEDENGPVLELDRSHPARRFLEAFIDCLSNCVGRHYGFDGQIPIDQEWTSSTDGRKWTFSGFAYAFLSFDIVLDGFLQGVPHLTESEAAATEELPKLRLMMDECAQAARQDRNSDILELTDQVQRMLGLWDEYLGFRQEMISHAAD